jgi:hypothetical protein
VVDRDAFPRPPAFDTEKPIPLENAKWDLSALGTENLITLKCVGCKTEAKYGNTLEGVARLYFQSRWTVLNRDARFGSPVDVDALCEKCLNQAIAFTSDAEGFAPEARR